MKISFLINIISPFPEVLYMSYIPKQEKIIVGWNNYITKKIPNYSTPNNILKSATKCMNN